MELGRLASREITNDLGWKERKGSSRLLSVHSKTMSISIKGFPELGYLHISNSW